MEMLFGDLSTVRGRVRHSLERQLGFRHNSLTEPPAPEPGEAVLVMARAGIDVEVKSAEVFYTVDGADPLSELTSGVGVIEMSKGDIEWNEITAAYSEIWSAVIPAQLEGTLVRYSIKACLATGETLFCQAGGSTKSNETKQGFAYYVTSNGIPDWFRESVIYQLMPDRFHPGNNVRFAQISDLSGIVGGTISGVIEKLDYLSSLKIDCIWMTPIFPSPGHHGYDATAYDGIEPRLGTIDDFNRLTVELKKRGIKLILDFVANHVSSNHPFFQQAVKDRGNKYVSWFKFSRWPDVYECYYSLPDMPILNTDNPEVCQYLVEQALAWLDRGVHGLRLDHAHGLSHLFWSRFRQLVRERHPEALMIGEVIKAPDDIRTYSGRLDGCFDFKLAELMRRYFALQKMKTSEFVAQVERHLLFSGAAMENPTFLDNHDMNRFLWLANGDKRKLKVAALFQFCLPAPPVLYYGTETGLSQNKSVGRLEEARLPMNWNEEDHDLLEFYRQLIAFRKAISVDVRKAMHVVKTDDAAGVLILAFANMLVVCNNKRKIARIPIESAFTKNVRLILSTDVRAKIDGCHFEMPPYSAAVAAYSSEN